MYVLDFTVAILLVKGSFGGLSLEEDIFVKDSYLALLGVWSVLFFGLFARKGVSNLAYSSLIESE